MSIFSELAMQ